MKRELVEGMENRRYTEKKIDNLFTWKTDTSMQGYRYKWLCKGTSTISEKTGAHRIVMTIKGEKCELQRV